MRLGREDRADERRPFCVEQHAVPSLPDLDLHDGFHQIRASQFQLDHSDGALADGVHDGDRNVQQILAFRLLVDVADVQPTVSVGEGFPPPELIAVEVPDGGRHACDQGPPLVRHQDVLILAGPDTEPVPKKEQRPSMDETREKPVPASPVSLPQRAALQQPGLSRLRLLHPVGVVGRLYRRPHRERRRRQMARAIDLVIDHDLDPACGRGGDLLKAPADRGFDRLDAIEVGREEGDDSGREADDQKGGDEFLLEAPSRPAEFHEAVPSSLHDALDIPLPKRSQGSHGQKTIAEELPAETPQLVRRDRVDVGQDLPQRDMAPEVQLVLGQFAHPAARALEPQHEVALQLALGPLQFGAPDRLALQPTQLLEDEPDRAGRRVRPDPGIDRHQPAVRKARDEGINGVGQPAFLPHLLEQAGTDAPAQDGVQRVDRVPILVAVGDAFGAHADVSLLQRLRTHVHAFRDRRRDPVRGPGLGIPWASERRRTLLQHRPKGEIPRHRDNHLRGSVMPGPERQQRGPAERFDGSDFPEHGPSQRVGAEGILGVQVMEVILRVVFDHPDLFQHHLLLLGHFSGVKPGMVEDVREQVEALRQVLVQNLGVEGGALPGRKGIELPAERVDLPRDGLGGAPPSALEDHVLDEVREALLARLLIARADIHPDPDRDRPHRRYPLGDHPHAIVQYLFSEHADCVSDRYDCAEAFGSGIASLRLSRILPCRSTSSTFTSTSSPSLTSSDTALTRWCASCEICTSPSTPGSTSTKAPKSMIFLTLPMYSLPTSTSSVIWFTRVIAFWADASSLEAIVTVPSSSTSIFTPQVATMSRMTLPPGPMTSRIFSGVILSV